MACQPRLMLRSLTHLSCICNTATHASLSRAYSNPRARHFTITSHQASALQPSDWKIVIRDHREHNRQRCVDSSANAQFGAELDGPIAVSFRYTLHTLFYDSFG